jgi:nucleoside 2-deoxyribosyltransferase
MNRGSKILVIGQAFVDIDRSNKQSPLWRLGGVMHAVRALAATKIEFSLAYIGPQYLDNLIEHESNTYGVKMVCKIGNVSGAPNILDIGEPRECGDQGYYMPLYEEHHQSEVYLDKLKILMEKEFFKDALILAGQFDLGGILEIAKGHNIQTEIDLGNVSVQEWRDVRTKIAMTDTIIISTSSRLFLDEFNGSVVEMKTNLHSKTSFILLKENRGGSRFFNFQDPDNDLSIPSHPCSIRHSVGVGDCFDAIYLSERTHAGNHKALCFASVVAMEYASTYNFAVFYQAAQKWLASSGETLISLKGITLPWEKRPSFNIYIAAPDFSGTDRTHIEAIVNILKYHNFMPRLPIRENGEVNPDATPADQERLFNDDLDLLLKCKLLIAVLPFPDAGSLIEIGIAFEKGIPILVYRPNGKETNIMLTQSAESITNDIDELITKVYDVCNRLQNNA